MMDRHDKGKFWISRLELTLEPGYLVLMNFPFGFADIRKQANDRRQWRCQGPAHIRQIQLRSTGPGLERAKLAWTI